MVKYNYYSIQQSDFEKYKNTISTSISEALEKLEVVKSLSKYIYDLECLEEYKKLQNKGFKSIFQFSSRNEKDDLQRKVIVRKILENEKYAPAEKHVEKIYDYLEKIKNADEQSSQINADAVKKAVKFITKASQSVLDNAVIGKIVKIDSVGDAVDAGIDTVTAIEKSIRSDDLSEIQNKKQILNELKKRIDSEALHLTMDVWKQISRLTSGVVSDILLYNQNVNNEFEKDDSILPRSGLEKTFENLQKEANRTGLKAIQLVTRELDFFRNEILKWLVTSKINSHAKSYQEPFILKDMTHSLSLRYAPSDDDLETHFGMKFEDGSLNPADLNDFVEKLQNASRSMEIDHNYLEYFVSNEALKSAKPDERFSLLPLGWGGLPRTQLENMVLNGRFEGSFNPQIQHVIAPVSKIQKELNLALEVVRFKKSEQAAYMGEKELFDLEPAIISCIGKVRQLDFMNISEIEVNWTQADRGTFFTRLDEELGWQIEAAQKLRSAQHEEVKNALTNRIRERLQSKTVVKPLEEPTIDRIAPNMDMQHETREAVPGY